MPLISQMRNEINLFKDKFDVQKRFQINTKNSPNQCLLVHNVVTLAC